MRSTDVLFQPFSNRGLELPNRIVMAPMTRLKSSNQTPDEKVTAYYRRHADGGLGLILTEGVSPEHKSSAGYRRAPAFFGDAPLKAWQAVAALVHETPCKIMPQLWHIGALREAHMSPYPDQRSLGPSGLHAPDKPAVGAPMTESEIGEVIAGFAASARYARALGFDGVEIHGAHGYIIDQFFWPAVNLRDDQYGGSLENRQRMAVEIVKETRRQVGPDFPILFRFSQWKQQDYAVRLAPTPKALEAFLAPLAAAGVDIFHCSTRRYWEPEFAEDGSDMNLAGWTRKITGLPTISVGSVSLDGAKAGQRGEHIDLAGIDRLLDMMERGDFDLIAVGRALIANPNWPNLVKAGRYDELKAYEPQMLVTI